MGGWGRHLLSVVFPWPCWVSGWAGGPCHVCPLFSAMVNINEAVGAGPSGRPGLPPVGVGVGEMEIMLCILDRAFNLASEAVGARAAQGNTSLPRTRTPRSQSQSLQTSAVPLASPFAGVPPHFSASSSPPPPLRCESSSLLILLPTGPAQPH